MMEGIPAVSRLLPSSVACSDPLSRRTSTLTEERDEVLSILASSLMPEGTSVSSSGLDMSVQSRSLSDSGRGETPGADQAGRLTSSTEADWGGRSHGGPGHGVALPAAGRGWALSGTQ